FFFVVFLRIFASNSFLSLIPSSLLLGKLPNEPIFKKSKPLQIQGFLHIHPHNPRKNEPIFNAMPTPFISRPSPLDPFPLGLCLLSTKLATLNPNALPAITIPTMPTYEYVCEKCGHEFEKFQSMAEKPLSVCPQDLCARKKWGRGKVKKK